MTFRKKYTSSSSSEDISEDIMDELSLIELGCSSRLINEILNHNDSNINSSDDESESSSNEEPIKKLQYGHYLTKKKYISSSSSDVPIKKTIKKINNSKLSNGLSKKKYISSSSSDEKPKKKFTKKINNSSSSIDIPKKKFTKKINSSSSSSDEKPITKRSIRMYGLLTHKPDKKILSSSSSSSSSDDIPKKKFTKQIKERQSKKILNSSSSNDIPKKKFTKKINSSSSSSSSSSDSLPKKKFGKQINSSSSSSSSSSDSLPKKKFTKQIKERQSKKILSSSSSSSSSDDIPKKKFTKQIKERQSKKILNNSSNIVLKKNPDTKINGIQKVFCAGPEAVVMGENFMTVSYDEVRIDNPLNKVRIDNPLNKVIKINHMLHVMIDNGYINTNIVFHDDGIFSCRLKSIFFFKRISILMNRPIDELIIEVDSEEYNFLNGFYVHPSLFQFMMGNLTCNDRFIINSLIIQANINCMLTRICVETIDAKLL